MRNKEHCLTWNVVIHTVHKVLLGYYDGERNECIQNSDSENSWKASTWKTKKEGGGSTENLNFNLKINSLLPFHFFFV